ncbi:hypothetical protein LPJ38_34165 [Bradyrhizobium daqingense]|uniref:O-antigen ligase-like membrane protein n=1 Tax=Bradyrhizobium daqingense TaxID=993502 RepID=A0A562KB63_9BRAD|nr:hypothetical protein [Bradyrhizobium daqingense]TWH92661.1 hypothetical protein IQ17_07125 [Bradyrhizobium daqingense]UFS88620.1 hypothetical protein LPJ38_34165 [Bradyrhizobium daqingense]
MVSLDTFPARASSNKRATAASSDETNSVIFAHIAFILCICMQRFGLLIGTGQIFFSLFGFFALVAWGWWVNLVSIRAPQTLAFGLVVVWFLFSAVAAVESPDRGVEISPASLAMVLVTNSIFLFGPSTRFSNEAVLPVFLFYVRLCAVLAIVQIVLQFGGIRIFSFKDAIPALDPVLVESAYNQNAVEFYGSLNRRANGFFPMEPGALSQLLAIGVVVDVFFLRRLAYLPLYAVSYVLTRSGSGLLVLVVSLGVYPVIAPLKSLRVIAIGAAVALMLGTTYLVAPEPFDPIVSRLDEFSSTKSSGYARYVAQLQTWEYLFQTDRVLIGSGPGGLERSPAYFGGSGNPLLKLVADYGIIGLLIFLFYLVLSIFRKDNSMLALTMLACYQLGGGNLAMAPFLIMMAMLCVWSQPPGAGLWSIRPKAAPDRGVPARSAIIE